MLQQYSQKHGGCFASASESRSYPFTAYGRFPIHWKHTSSNPEQLWSRESLGFVNFAVTARFTQLPTSILPVAGLTLRDHSTHQAHSQLKRFLPAATKLGQGNVFTGVCDSVHGGCLPQCMLGYHPPEQNPTRKQTPAYGQRAAGTHPTGMHSCQELFQAKSWDGRELWDRRLCESRF